MYYTPAVHFAGTVFLQHSKYALYPNPPLDTAPLLSPTSNRCHARKSLLPITLCPSSPQQIPTSPLTSHPFPPLPLPLLMLRVLRADNIHIPLPPHALNTHQSAQLSSSALLSFQDHKRNTHYTPYTPRTASSRYSAPSSPARNKNPAPASRPARASSPASTTVLRPERGSMKLSTSKCGNFVVVVVVVGRGGLC